MFLDDEDRDYFIELLKRYLSRLPHEDSRGKCAPSLRSKVRLIAFALMTTPFHLILFQITPDGMDDLMNRVMMSYVKYFNRRHGMSGPMFAGEYRADRKSDRRAQLTAIAYVHDNHAPDCGCRHCGHRYFTCAAADVPSWIGAAGALRQFGGRDEYLRYRQARRTLAELAR